jgi:hypothetical protein
MQRSDEMIVEHGPSIGEHHGRSVPAFIVTDDGVRMEFVRTAIEIDGGVELSQLGPGECVIAPGLIYRPAAVQ